MFKTVRGPLLKSVAAASAALLMLGAGSVAAARDHSEAEALSPRACGAVGGGLADPADTQRCLAERYKAPKPKPARTPAPSPSSNSASAASPVSEPAAASNTPSATN